MANDQYPDAKELGRRRSKNPELFGSGRPGATRPAGPGGVGSQTVPPALRPAAALLRLAARLGKDPEQLARDIPPETLRRLRHSMIEERVEDGKRTFTHDLGIVEGIRSLIRL